MKRFLILLPFLSVIFSGCFSTKNDAINIRLELRELRKEVRDIRKLTADMRLEFDNQNIYLQQLSGKVDASRVQSSVGAIHKSSFEEVSKRLYAMEEQLMKLWFSTAPIAAALPEDIYASAKADYQRGDLDLSILSLNRLIETYPDSPLLPLAMYDLTTAYYAQGDWEKTVESADVFVSSYAGHEYVSRVLLAKALALRQKGEHVKAKHVLEGIVEVYPLTEESDIAKDELDSIILGQE